MFHLFQSFPELSTIFVSLMYTYTRNSNYAALLAGGVLTIFIGAMLKKISNLTIGLLPKSLIMRPPGAYFCNMQQQTDCSNEVGMPSIHSMLAGFYVANINKVPVQYQTFLLTLLVLVPFSRLSKADNWLINHGEHGCHTYPQIFVGFAIGYYFGNSMQ